MLKFIDLTEQKFGRLIVIKWIKKDDWGKSQWLCKCNCGNKIIIRGDSLRSGNTKSCGCLRKEKTKQQFIKHGHTENGKITGIYQSWQNMKNRCINSNGINYKNYGDRGIMVCDEWLHSFTNFERDNPGWKPGLALERRNNELGYFKDNCYWATPKQQQRNRRNNHLITAFGKTQCIVMWSEETGISADIIRARIDRDWSSERALTIPIRKYKKRRK